MVYFSSILIKNTGILIYFKDNFFSFKVNTYILVVNIQDHKSFSIFYLHTNLKVNTYLETQILFEFIKFFIHGR